MKKVAIEVLRRRGETVTVIIPDNLTEGEILGLANELLVQLGLPSVKLQVEMEKAIGLPLEQAYGEETNNS